MPPSGPLLCDELMCLLPDVLAGVVAAVLLTALAAILWTVAT